MAKKALLVGINDYRSIDDLQGCINDITNIRDVLIKYYGFAVPDIRVLADSRATKQNILLRLDWLVDKAARGDLLVFHYSGHGTSIRDRDGDELKDHMDEAICPWDMNWDNGFILDDELGSIFGKLPGGVTLEVILDSCFSGTGTRDPGKKPRYMPPPVDIECRMAPGLETRRLGFKSLEKAQKPANQILWAASRDDQSSDDALIGNTYNGAFTYYFCNYVRDSQGKISRKDLLDRVRASLKHHHHTQVPQLEVSDPKAAGEIVFH